MAKNTFKRLVPKWSTILFPCKWSRHAQINKDKENRHPFLYHILQILRTYKKVWNDSQWWQREEFMAGYLKHCQRYIYPWNLDRFQAVVSHVRKSVWVCRLRDWIGCPKSVLLVEWGSHVQNSDQLQKLGSDYGLSAVKTVFKWSVQLAELGTERLCHSCLITLWTRL